MEDEKLNRGLKSRHVTMIAIGGAIGTDYSWVQVRPSKVRPINHSFLVNCRNHYLFYDACLRRVDPN